MHLFVFYGIQYVSICFAASIRYHYLGGGFKYFFLPRGNDSIWRAYCSKRLKPPTSLLKDPKMRMMVKIDVGSCPKPGLILVVLVK